MAGLLPLSCCSKTETISENNFKPCQKVVTIGPTLTELMVAMGQTETLLAVSRYDKLPAGLVRPSIGGILDPEIEAIAALGPDCIFYIPAGPTVAAKLQPLQKMGLRVIEFEVPDLAQLPAAVQKIGKLLGHMEAAEILISRMEKEKQKLSTKSLSQKNVLVIYDRAPLVAAGHGSLGDDLLQISGWNNLVKGNGYPIIDEEFLAAAKPDLLLDLSQNSSEASWTHLLPASTRIITSQEESLRHPGPDSVAKWIELLGKIEKEEKKD